MSDLESCLITGGAGFVATGHGAVDYGRVARAARLVVDTCNAVPRGVSGARVVRLGAP